MLAASLLAGTILVRQPSPAQPTCPLKRLPALGLSLLTSQAGALPSARHRAGRGRVARRPLIPAAPQEPEMAAVT